jgi:predicted ATPase/DNA-binding XRE family transcriptional regulator
MLEQYSFGDWLRLKRKALDLTLEGLANRVGCSASTIRKLEEEERRPSAQIVGRLAEVFSIPQTERAAFLRFARGGLQSAPTGTKEEFPWQVSATPTRSNLPATVTSRVGRERELAEVHDYLSRDDIRLVSLIGPPGIGKTRLSIEAARLALPAFPDGTFFVALAPLDNSGLIAQTIAQSLGFVGATNLPVEEQLRQGIGDRHMLIVMDNCEHLVEDVARLAFDLLSACPRLTILATSREVLRVPGEWIYAVPAFEVPDENLLGDVKIAHTFPALSLFAERARAVQTEFALSVENLTTVCDICKKLDGLPLAIELIAARTRSLSPQVLLERLDTQFILTADGMRTVPARQKTLNNAIGWSYNLLSSYEQILFAYLSAYSGGFTLDMAEGTFRDSFTQRAVADLVISLFDKSLLQRSFDSSGEAGYAMLATIQEFARQRLRETGQEATIRNWHLAYFLELAGQADRELRGPDQSKWLNQLNRMHDNLRVALDWAIETGQTEMALQMARRLWWFWCKRSEFSEGRQWLGRVLAMPDVSRFSESYGDVLTQLAHHTWLQVGAEAAKLFIEQALTIARVAGNPQTLANALMVFGLVLSSGENLDAARSALEESVTLFREVQDPWGNAVALMSLGFAAYKRDDPAKALELGERALLAFRELGDQYFQSACLYATGSLRAMQGDWDGGLAELRESLRLSRALGSRYEIANGLRRLADTEQHLGHPARAVQLYWAAKNVYDSIGAWRQESESKFAAYIELCRVSSEESTFAEAVETGRVMTLEQALAYALEEQK